jgi:uncharacterized protein YejL (UPF0352 family)
MPYISKHSTEKLELIVEDLIATLEKHETTTELSLIALGNSLSHLFNTRIELKQRKRLVEKFNQSLTHSISSDNL